MKEPNKITQTIIAKMSDGLEIKAEISDTKESFCFRLCCGEDQTKWTSDYEGILILKSNNRCFGFVTHYWSGDLLAETPFEIINPTDIQRV